MQENKFYPLSQQTEAIQETETQNLVSPSIGTPSASLKGTSAEDPKGMTLEDEEEEQETDESEEEGEIGESQTSIRRSTRGHKTDKEKREQETYKDKL